MNTLRVSWPVPTLLAGQLPLQFVSVEVQTDPSLPFAEVARAGAVVSPGQTDLQLDNGDYNVRVRFNDGTAGADGGFGPYSDVASITLVTEPPARVAPSKPGTVTLTQTA